MSDDDTKPNMGSINELASKAEHVESHVRSLASSTEDAMQIVAVVACRIIDDKAMPADRQKHLLGEFFGSIILSWETTQALAVLRTQGAETRADKHVS